MGKDLRQDYSDTLDLALSDLKNAGSKGMDAHALRPVIEALRGWKIPDAQLGTMRSHAQTIRQLTHRAAQGNPPRADEVGALIAKVLGAMAAIVRPAVAERFSEAQANERRYLLAQVEAAQEAATAAQDAARTAAAEVHVRNFHQRAVDHEEAARGWLIAGGIGAFAWVTGALMFASEVSAKEGWPAIGVRLFVLSACLGFVAFCGRSYSANRHNAIINSHRATAIDTMHAFVTAAGDRATKDGVVMQVTAGTFAPAATGYETRSTAPAEPPVAKLLDAMRR